MPHLTRDMSDEQKPQEMTETAAVPSAIVEPPAAAEAAPAPAAQRTGVPMIGAPAWDPQPGQVVRVHQRIKETTKKGQEKERLQVFEGIVIARRHGSEPGATFTVRKDIKGGFAVERIFPLHAPTVAKVEVVRAYRTRRAKLHFLRDRLKKGKKLREIESTSA